VPDADAQTHTNEAARLLHLFLAARKTGGSYDLDIIAANVEAVLNALDDAQDRLDWLACLEAAGVDNWSGYKIAREIKRGDA